jgi:hypothetical protein
MTDPPGFCTSGKITISNGGSNRGIQTLRGASVWVWADAGGEARSLGLV